MHDLPAGRDFCIRLIFVTLAVFSGWNTTAAMSDDDWILYFREAEPSSFLISVNQAISSGRRPPRHDSCHELRFHFGPDHLAEQGMPNAEAYDLYGAVEAELDNLLSGGKGELVARRTGQNKRSVWFCTREEVTSKVQALIGAGQSTSIELRPAPLTEVTALHPTTIEVQLAHDYEVVYSLAQNGDNHSMPRKIDHFIYGKSNHGAIEARLRKLGFEIEPDQRPDAILFFRVAPIDIDAIQNDTRLLMSLCAEFGCDYDGWGAPVMRRD